jgi:hypothetical protein
MVKKKVASDARTSKAKTKSGPSTNSEAQTQAQGPTARRLALLANGYLPVPVVGKQSFLDDLATITPTEAMIRDWEHARAEQGTGVLTRTTPAIDIDILDEATAEAIEDFTRDYFKGGRLMRRIGQAPKRAFLFRTAAPFAKLQALFTAPDGSDHKIRILGNGQMLTVDAIHPVTQQPYTWAGGAPWEVPAAELLELTGEKARAWLDAVTDLLVARGWQRNGKSAALSYATERDWYVFPTPPGRKEITQGC